MEEAQAVIDPVAQADDITTGLTLALLEVAREEILDLEERGVSPKLARHFAVNALQRAAMAIQGALE